MILRFLFMGAGLLASIGLGGCKSEEPPPPPGRFVSPTSALAVGERVFVGSPTDDGLRVFAAAGSVASEGCAEDADCAGGQICEADRCVRAVEEVLRAPDPIFALVVPALRSPGRLVALPGAKDERDLLLVCSEVDPQLRVIDADGLVPLGLPVPLPGRATDLAWAPGLDAIFVLVDAPLQGADRLGPSAVLRLDLEAGARTPGELFGRAPASAVALWPLPVRAAALAVSEVGGEIRVWIASAESAEVLSLDPTDGVRQRMSLPGKVSRLLAAPVGSRAGGAVTEHGERVFALAEDGHTLLAFDGLDGRVVPELIDAGGTVRPVILPGGATEIAITPDLTLAPPGVEAGSEPTLTWTLLAGMINGDTIYIDGEAMRTFDLDGDPKATPFVGSLAPEATDTSAPRIQEIDNPEYDPQDPTSAPRVPAITLTPGVTRSRTWAISYRAILPGQSDVLGLLQEIAGEIRLVPTRPPENFATLLKVGDAIEILDHPDRPEGCVSLVGASYEVAAVEIDPLSLRLQAPGAGTLPDPACAPTPLRYQVRVSDFLISASGLVEVFRARAGETFTYAGEPFRAEADLGPAFELLLEAEQADLDLGATRLVEVRSGADPWRIDAKGNLGASAFFPGVPAITRDPSDAQGRVFLPFAGLNGIFAFDLATGEGRASLR